MPKTKLCAYWSPWHTSASDEEFFAQWKPRVIKIMVNSLDDVAQLDVALRNAGLVIVRSYPLSEDRSAMATDPAALGRKHAGQLIELAAKLKAKYGLSDDDARRILYEGINEPKLWTQDEAPERTAEYYSALVETAGAAGVRIVALNAGIGWPGNHGVYNAPPDWTPYSDLADAIIEYDGVLGLHEYWGLNGADELWGWWAGRYLTCPYNVPIIITECGIDTGVLGQQNLGWHMLIGVDGMSVTAAAERYVYNDLGKYDVQLQLDPRIIGATIFTYDFQNKEWESFDINHGDIKAALKNHVGWMENQDIDTFERWPLPPMRDDVDWYLPPFNADNPPPEPPPDPTPPPANDKWYCKLLKLLCEAFCGSC